MVCENFCSDLANLCSSHLSHYHILAFLNEFSFRLDNCLQELYVLNVSAMCFYTVDKVLNDAFINLTAKLEVVHENVLHCHCFQNLMKEIKQRKKLESKQTTKSTERSGWSQHFCRVQDLTKHFWGPNISTHWLVSKAIFSVHFSLLNFLHWNGPKQNFKALEGNKMWPLQPVLHQNRPRGNHQGQSILFSWWKKNYGMRLFLPLG